MLPAKEFFVARKHFGETSKYSWTFSSLSDLCDAISKTEPLIETRAYIMQELYKRTVQVFYLF